MILGDIANDGAEHGETARANESRSMRRANSRRIDRALNFFASWSGRKSAESIEVTQRDDGVTG